MSIYQCHCPSSQTLYLEDTEYWNESENEDEGCDCLLRSSSVDNDFDDCCRGKLWHLSSLSGHHVDSNCYDVADDAVGC